MDLDFHVVWTFSGALAQGLRLSVTLTVVCMALGSLLGALLALERTSGSLWLSLPATAYVELLRGTPVLIQLFWVFFCLPLVIGFEPSNFASGVIALSLSMGAITAETFRAALRSISRDQKDACAALGLSRWARTRYVVLPQALLRATPVLLSNTITLFKESALVSAVGLADLMFIGGNISNSVGRPIEVLTSVAAIYFVIAFPLTRVVTRVEKGMLRKLAL